ncbi:glycosyltransferase [Frankia sp. CiP1_Cm_nod2]|uniref:glycosyltransferase n=1 Tax=Frankia sp. CiP1_Cm_nod2 TaxID=2897161 RepID=UPI0020254860
MIALPGRRPAEDAAGPVAGPVRPLPAAGTRPLVSIFVSSYNYARFLPQCLTSVLTQDYDNIDVYVIDDASADNSAEVAGVFAAADPRFRIIRRSVNRGHMETFNEGLAAARGEYFIKLDADDLLTPGSLARSVAFAEHNPAVGFVYGEPVAFAASPLPPARTAPASWSLWPGHAWLAHVCRLGHNAIAQPEALIRTATLRAAGYYNPDLPHTFDMEMWMRLAVLADVGTIDGADQGYYRIHSASMQHTINSGVLRDLEGRRDAFVSVLTGPGKDVPNAEELLTTARRTLAVKALRHACDLLGASQRRGPIGHDALGARADERDQAEGFVAFAEEVYPAARELAPWATVDGLLRADPRVVMRHRARTTARAAVRQARAHVRPPGG